MSWIIMIELPRPDVGTIASKKGEHEKKRTVFSGA